jgi:hypothetical protein
MSRQAKSADCGDGGGGPGLDRRRRNCEMEFEQQQADQRDGYPIQRYPTWFVFQSQHMFAFAKISPGAIRDCRERLD